VSLQSILREQLGQGSFREADVDWQANLRVLCAAAKSSKILLVLDDLWYAHLHTAHSSTVLLHVPTVEMLLHPRLVSYLDIIHIRAPYLPPTPPPPPAPTPSLSLFESTIPRDGENFTQLNCVDSSNGSRVVITTRLR
jgi:hypothetical protein